MALSISELNSVSHKYFDKTIAETAYDQSPFFAKLASMGKVVVNGGTTIQVPIRYKKLGLAGAVNPRSQITFEGAETRTALDDNWTFYVGKTVMFWDEVVKNGQEGRIIDLLKDKAKELKEDIQDILATDLFATSRATTANMTPLAVIVDSAATYGGIAVADAANWASTEDNSTTQLVLYGSGSLAYNVNACTLGTDKPTMHITTRNLYSKFESLAQPQQALFDKGLADMGFDNTLFHGVPVVADAYCTAAYWYGLDMNQFELMVNTKGDANGISITEWMDLTSQGFPNASGKFAEWVGNVVCRKRKTSFKCTTLNYAL